MEFTSNKMMPLYTNEYDILASMDEMLKIE